MVVYAEFVKNTINEFEEEVKNLLVQTQQLKKEKEYFFNNIYYNFIKLKDYYKDSELFIDNRGRLDYLDSYVKKTEINEFITLYTKRDYWMETYYNLRDSIKTLKKYLS